MSAAQLILGVSSNKEIMKSKSLEEINKESDEFNDKINSAKKSSYIFMAISAFYYLVFSPSGLMQNVAFILFIFPTGLSVYKYPANNKKRYLVQSFLFIICIYIYSNYV